MIVMMMMMADQQCSVSYSTNILRNSILPALSNLIPKCYMQMIF